jgi:epoxyqueuosine reductase QueG
MGTILAATRPDARKGHMADIELMGELRRTAEEADIDLIGATSAEPLPLDEGDWWGHDQPRDLLPAAGAVVVAGFCVRYEPRLVASEAGRPRGRFTNFGSRVFEQMESHCWETVGGFLESRGYAAVRAPRLAIKPAIVRSGLGRYGKHAVVITPQLGSMVMWAALVTDAPLADPAADAPVFATLCPDGCAKCVEACPTGALAGDYALDRSRCITNWLWGAFIPAELRAHQGARLFGCAECLLACPANAGVVPRAAASYPVAVDAVNDSPELLPLVAGDAAYYDATIPTFPRQAGRETMRASAVVALGNSEDATVELEPLREALVAGDARLRAYATWALGRLGTDAARALLRQASGSETDPSVAEEIRAALGQGRPGPARALRCAGSGAPRARGSSAPRGRSGSVRSSRPGSRTA